MNFFSLIFLMLFLMSQFTLQTNYDQTCGTKIRMSTNLKSGLDKFHQCYLDTQYFKFHSTSPQIQNQRKYNSTEHVTV